MFIINLITSIAQFPHHITSMYVICAFINNRLKFIYMKIPKNLNKQKLKKQTNKENILIFQLRITFIKLDTYKQTVSHVTSI